MSNRKKSVWERDAQYRRNQDRHIRIVKEKGEDGEIVEHRVGTKKYFTAQRKILAAFKRLNHQQVKK